uniref:N-acetyltransferase domain-containing protein n=1 Tax=Aegilops tauschii subsp. strangulata TaxID=200361 RepID=A0A453IWW8_AEGTS
MCQASSTWGDIPCGMENSTNSFVLLLSVSLEVTFGNYSQEPGNTPFYSRIYQPDQPKFGYLTNVCVAKYARRQGIASNMLLLAIDAARLDGAESIYIHVHKDNLPARRLYDHVGFKVYIIFFAKKLSFFHLVIKL